MRLGWATRLPLHQMSVDAFRAFAAEVAGHGLDRLLLTGPTSSARDLCLHLELLTARVGLPVAALLTPADFAGGSIPALRAELAARVRDHELLDWLGLGHVLPLGKGRALVGHGGWPDAREGRPGDRPLAGEGLGIHELEGQPRARLVRRLMRLGEDAGLALRGALQQAAVRHDEVWVATQALPFRELCADPDDEAEAAATVCGATGRALREAALRFPEVRFVVLCVGPLSGTLRPLPNLRVLAHTPPEAPGGLIVFDLPDLAQRADRAAPLIPDEVASTVMASELQRAMPSGHRPGQDEIFARLQDELSAPDGGTYPLPDGEGPADWGQRARDALDRLAAGRGLMRQDRDGTTLGEWLHALATLPLAPSLERTVGRVRLLGELIRNIANPWRINQGHKGTCSVTAIESWLAARDPAELARLCYGLCRPEGQVLLYTGVPLIRDEDQLEWDPAEARRSPISRLFQVAGMELANPEADYRNSSDAHYEQNTAGIEVNTGTGLSITDFDRLLEGLTGERWRTLTEQETLAAEAFARLGVDTSFMPRLDQDGEPLLRRVLAEGAGAFVTLEAGRDRGAALLRRAGEEGSMGLPHKVRVVRFDPEGDRVVYEDPFDPEAPWIPGVQTEIIDPGGLCAMARADFLALMVELSVEERFAPRGPTPAPPAPR